MDSGDNLKHMSDTNKRKEPDVNLKNESKPPISPRKMITSWHQASISKLTTLLSALRVSTTVATSME